MTNQDQFALSLLSVCLMKQHATLEDMDAMLNCLTERMDSVSEQHQNTDCLMKQSSALESLDARLNSLTERVGSTVDRNQCTNLTLGMLTVCLMQQKEALGQVSAMVRDLTDRVDSVERLERQMGRTHRGVGSPTQRAAKKTRHLARQKQSSRGRAN